MMVLAFEEALGVVSKAAAGAAAGMAGRHVEKVGLLEAVGRVLAEGVRADRDQPGFDRATRDGFALRAAGLGSDLKVVGQVRAGEMWAGALGAGEAVEIMTGAPMPAGADAVLMVEHAVVSSEEEGGGLRAAAGRGLRTGENVVARGSEARAGERVVAAGVRVGAAEVALAATCGCAELMVWARPVVAIVATGDELVEVGETPAAWQIRNSNSYALAALVTAAGGSARRLAIARDTRDDLRAQVREALEADLVVFSGGVSMGQYDLVEEVLAEFGAEFLFTGVTMQPGKPVVFGRFAAMDTYFFGLPGNPVSTQVTFAAFAEMLVRGLGGETVAGPRWGLGRLGEAVPAKDGVTRLLPCRLDGVAVRLVGWQGSGDLAANARANCYGELLPGQAYGVGDVVRVLLRQV